MAIISKDIRMGKGRRPERPLRDLEKVKQKCLNAGVDDSQKKMRLDSLNTDGTEICSMVM